MRNLNLLVFESLRKEDKKGYLARLTLSTGEQLPDLFIFHSNWSDDVSSLPDITYLDIYHYLIEYPSQFSKESLTAYKLLESYIFLVSGNVQNVYYHEVEKKCKFYFAKFLNCLYTKFDVKILYYLSISNIKFHKSSSLILTVNDLRCIFSYSKLGVNSLLNQFSFFHGTAPSMCYSPN